METAKRTMAGYEAVAMIRKGQVHNVGGRDVQAQAAFVAGLFKVAAALVHGGKCGQHSS